MLALVLLALSLGCERPEPSPQSPAPTEAAPPAVAPPAEATADPEGLVVSLGERAACEPEELADLDLENALRGAVTAIRETAPDSIEGCRQAVHVCAGPADGTSCAFSVRGYPEVLRVTVWPKAAEGGLVEGTAILSRALESAAPPQLSERRWGRSPGLRCRGGRAQRSYGPPSVGEISAGRVSATCWNEGDTALAIQSGTVEGPGGGTRPLDSIEPQTLEPGVATAVQVSFAPVRLRLRDANAFELSLTIEGRSLHPVAEITTPERRRWRR